MGAAAYNRGSRAISEQIAREGKPDVLVLMHDLDVATKNEGAPTPWGPIHFVAGNGGWWATCPTTGFGYHYPTLRSAIRSWNVRIVRGGVIGGEWIWVGEPAIGRLQEAS